MKFANIAKYLLWALMVISLVLVGIFFFGGFIEGTEGTSLAEPVITETILKWAYIIIIVAIKEISWAGWVYEYAFHTVMHSIVYINREIEVKMHG